MNDFFIKKYSSIKDRSKFLSKIRYYSAQRFMLRVLAVFFVPIWFEISNFFKEIKIENSKQSPNLIVSLTTFPQRINTIWIVIECMLRQSKKPDRIILWLSKEQFSSLDVLPKRLLNLQKRGLEIKLCEGDFRSHKKYFYVLKENPNDIVITIDDDFIYPSDLIEKLVLLNAEFPDAICCHRGFKISHNNNRLLPYDYWVRHFVIPTPSYDVFFTSGGGTLFPPYCFTDDVLNSEIFLKRCKFADDVWLNVMAQLNNRKTVKVIGSNDNIMPIIIRDNIELTSVNVGEGLNDIQLKELLDYLKQDQKLDWGIFKYKTN